MHPRRRICRVIAELTDTLRAKQWWNRNRNDATPFDLGADLAGLRIARQMLAAWDRGDQDEVNRLQPELVTALDHEV